MSNLKAIKRENTSSGSNNKLRSEGLIPAILYGGKEANKNISIEKKEQVLGKEKVRVIWQILRKIL